MDQIDQIGPDAAERLDPRQGGKGRAGVGDVAVRAEDGNGVRTVLDERVKAGVGRLEDGLLLPSGRDVHHMHEHPIGSSIDTA